MKNLLCRHPKELHCLIPINLNSSYSMLEAKPKITLSIRILQRSRL